MSDGKYSRSPELERWDLASGRERPDIRLPGSPERCVIRRALEDADGRVWMLERLRPEQGASRTVVAETLDRLAAAGLAAAPAYRRTVEGGFRLDHGGASWQLSPYVPGDVLPQPEYVRHPERGAALGNFLGDLRAAAAAFGAETAGDDASRLGRAFLPETRPGFSLAGYAGDLAAAAARNRPDVYARLEPLLVRLASFLATCDALPRTLAHGDLHPLNVIWAGRAVRAVIDWEFLGPRPELYDVANCLGCVGMESPPDLTGPLAAELLRTLRARGVLTDANLPTLPPLAAVLRLAWLSEWLRREDEEMLQQELDYLRVLVHQGEELGILWARLAPSVAIW